MEEAVAVPAYVPHAQGAVQRRPHLCQALARRQRRSVRPGVRQPRRSVRVLRTGSVEGRPAGGTATQP
ncbi:hypothetical protein [Streptomyces violaceorubidus]|uniref:hypothetical protein n=1 Tax=Streptomyces violaceorubidus TaxID=284042 RepID=UPI0004BFF502|nr:hypothetical protein [Streptomyces violaceorubidus]